MFLDLYVDELPFYKFCSSHTYIRGRPCFLFFQVIFNPWASFHCGSSFQPLRKGLWSTALSHQALRSWKGLNFFTNDRSPSELLVTQSVQRVCRWFCPAAVCAMVPDEIWYSRVRLPWMREQLCQYWRGGFRWVIQSLPVFSPVMVWVGGLQKPMG